MRYLLAVFLSVTLLLVSSSVDAIESVYPSGYSIQAGYAIPTTEVPVGETLVIERWLVNYESFTISGLYFADHLPEAFDTIRVHIQLNGNTVDHGSHTTTSVFPGNEAVHTIIDDPDSVQPSTFIGPGDSLHMTLSVLSTAAGDFQLKLHSSAFVAGSLPFFTLNDTVTTVTFTSVSCCEHRGDVNGDSGDSPQVDVSDLTYLVDFLFKAGAQPVCMEEANIDGSVGGEGDLVNISDLTVLVDFLFRGGAAPPPCP